MSDSKNSTVSSDSVYFSQRIGMWCPIIAGSHRLSSFQDGVSLVKTYDLLAYCQRKSGDLLAALRTLCTCMHFDPASVASCMERWVRIKYDAATAGDHAIQTL